MRHRYVVLHQGKPVGWVHARSAEHAIRKVCRVTDHHRDECMAAPFHVRKPTEPPDRGGRWGR